MDERVSEQYAALLDRFCNLQLEESGIYGSQYLGRHIKALEQTFPRIRAKLGTDCFRALACVYVRHFPPQEWDINRYGVSFPDLLAAQCHSPRADQYDWEALAVAAQEDYTQTCRYYGASDEQTNAG